MSKENAPAFQVYAAEYLADINTQLMTIEEEGCYWRLMLFCWREASLPTDSETLTALCKGVKPSNRVLLCFVLDGDRYIHPRLERERLKQEEWRRKCAIGGHNSAHKQKRKKEISSEQGSSANPPRVVEVNEQGSSRGDASLLLSKSEVKNSENSQNPQTKNPLYLSEQQGSSTLHLLSSSSISINPPTPLEGGRKSQTRKCEIGKTCNGKYEECHKAFDLLWTEYPRHLPGKTECRKAWCRQFQADQSIDAIVKYIRSAKPGWTDPKYIPHLTKFLNQRYWEGDLPFESKANDPYEKFKP